MSDEGHRDVETGTGGVDVLRALLSSLVKIALAPDVEGEGEWRTAALEEQRRWAGAESGIDRHRFDAAWSAAVAAAERDEAVRRGETVNPTLPTMAPLRPDQLTAEPFDLDGVVQTIREAASFG